MYTDVIVSLSTKLFYVWIGLLREFGLVYQRKVSTLGYLLVVILDTWIKFLKAKASLVGILAPLSLSNKPCSLPDILRSVPRVFQWETYYCYNGTKKS